MVGGLQPVRWPYRALDRRGKVTGTLAGTVNFGADGPSHGNGGFAFADKATVLAYMESLHLYSKQTATGDGPNGKELIYTLVGNVLTAYEPNPQGNPVFTLTLNPNGSFEFRLFDELVHVAGDGTNTDLRSGETGSISGINFGNIIVATDGDGDSVTLGNNFQIKIIDDVPHADIDLTGQLRHGRRERRQQRRQHHGKQRPKSVRGSGVRDRQRTTHCWPGSGCVGR